jgi:hypothetical protein
MLSMTPEQRADSAHQSTVHQAPDVHTAQHGNIRPAFDDVIVPEGWRGAYYYPRTPEEQAERKPWIDAARTALRGAQKGNDGTK